MKLKSIALLSVIAGIVLAIILWLSLPSLSHRFSLGSLSFQSPSKTAQESPTDIQSPTPTPSDSPVSDTTFHSPIPTTTESSQTAGSQNGVSSLQGLIGNLVLQAGKAIQVNGLTISNGGVTSFQGTSGDVTLTAGAGLSIDGVKFENSDRGSTQNIFKNIAVDGQNTIVADSNEDTLTFAAGSGITLLTDKDTGKLTITGSTSATATGFTRSGSTVSLVTATDNVGIGTSTPAYKLDVNGDVHVASGRDVYVGNIKLAANSSTSSGGSLVGLYDDALAYVSGNTTVQDAIKQLDTAIGSISGSAGGWTDGGTNVYLTTGTDKVGIGTITPASLFSVGSSSQFQVNSSGTIAAATGITSSGPITFSGLSTGVVTNTAGTLSSEAQLAVSRGGTGLSSYTTGDLLYASAGTTISKLGIGSSGTVLTSNGSAPTWGTIGATGITADSLDFSELKDGMTLDAATTVANAGFNFNITGAGNVGIGTSTPGTKLEVNGTIQGAVQDKGGYVYNVKAYGAVGDGVTNDRTAIVAAFTAASSAGGGTVYFPAGTYYVTSQINWPNTSNISMIGAGRGATTLLLDVGGSPATSIGVYINSGTTLSGVTIRDISIRGPANDDTAPYDLVQISNNVSDVLVDNVEFKWARHAGLRVSASTPGNRETVSNSYFHDIDSSGMTGIGGGGILSGLSTLKIQGTTFENVGNNALFHAVYLSTVDNATIVNNSFSGTHTRIQIYGGTATNVSIAGNIFRNVNKNNLWDTNGLTVSGNTFYEGGIDLGSHNVLISSNSFYATQTGAQIQNGSTANYIQVVGNKFVSTTSNPTLVSAIAHTFAGDKWIVTDNTFDGGYMKVAVFGFGDSHVFSRNEITTTYNNDTVHVNGATNVQINNNRINGASGSRIRLESGSATAQGNILLGSTIMFGLVNHSYVVDDGSGNVGIGNTSPSSMLSVGSTSQFQVNSSGAIAATTGITSSGKLDLTDSTTTAGVKGLSVSQTGAISGTGYAGYFSKTGASTTNIGLYATATGATTNYAAIFENGNVGIGTTSPGALLQVGTTTTAAGGGISFGGDTSLYRAGPGVLETGGQFWIGNSRLYMSSSQRTVFEDTGGGTPALRTGEGYNSVALRPGGVDRLTVLNTGLVGIGITGPAGYLDIGPTITAAGSATNYGLRIDPTLSGAINMTQTALYQNYNVPTINLTGGTSNTLTTLYGNYTGLTATAGTVGTWYGDYIAAPTGAGTVTNKYALVTEANAGNIGIGTTAPTTFKLEVGGAIGPTTDNTFDFGSSGKRWVNLYASNGTVQTSDVRLKDNIQNIDYGLDTLMKLRPVSFNWKGQLDSGRKLGLIAQEVQPIVGEVVNQGSDSNKTLGIYYNDLIPVVIKSIQEQQQEIDVLDTKVQDKSMADSATIAGKIDALTTQTGQMKNDLIQVHTALDSQNEAIASLSAKLAQGLADIETLKGSVLSASTSALLNNTLSDSALSSLATSSAVLDDLTVTGKTNVNDLGVTGSISAGLLAITGLDTSDATPSANIETLSGPLHLQKNGLGPLELMADKIVIDEKGNLALQEGNIELKKGKFIGNDTIRGVVTLPAGQHKVTVKQAWDAAPTSISAITTYDAHLWIEDLTKDGFTANVNPAASSEAKIYWSAIW